MACSKSSFTATVLFGLVASAANIFAGEKPFISTNSDGVAIKGYDAVAYFTLGEPKKGKAEFRATWKDATWYFASMENAELFKKEPEKYAPQYGAYCAWAVGNNYTYSADPLAWKIVEGKLYLNANKKVQAQWLKEIPELINKADDNWPAVLKK
jgi:YHS domain-containing protein